MSNSLLADNILSAKSSSGLVKTILCHKLALVVVISIVARLTIFLAFPTVFDFVQTGQIQGSDAYDAYARNLLATGVYGRTPGVPDAAIPPLYSYALAGVYGIFGRGALQVALFHIALDAISIVMLYHIAKRLMPHGEIVGALAGLFYALYPYLIFQNLTLIDTPLFMLDLHAFVLLMVLLRDQKALNRTIWTLAALGGLALGLGMLIRPILPPLALLVALWFLFHLNLKQTILRLLPVAVVGALVLTAWIIRNYGVYQAFVPMTTTSGANFWQGNSPFTIPYLKAGYDVQWTAPDIKDVDPNSREADAERFTLAIQFLRDHPEQIPDLLWTKFLVYWSIDVTPRLNPVDGKVPRLDYQGNVISATDSTGNLSLTGLPPGDPVNEYSQPLFDQIGRTVHRLYWGGLLLLGILGVALSWRYWRDVSLLWFVQISMTVIYVFFHPSTRYRVPSDPLLFIFSAYTLVWLWMWWKARQIKSIPTTAIHAPLDAHD